MVDKRIEIYNSTGTSIGFIATAVIAEFGSLSIQNETSRVDFEYVGLACDAISANLTGKVAIVEDASCERDFKFQNVLQAGGEGVIIIAVQK